MIILIDFDGTIVNDLYPKIGQMKPHAPEIIIKLKRAGHTLILNTCREGELLRNAIDFLENKGMHFDYYNENARANILKYKNDSRKIGGDLFIDDRNLGVIPDDWLEIYDLILKHK